ncbi:MAG: hypothetical protein ABGW50_02105 [Thermococcus sp.]
MPSAPTVNEIIRTRNEFAIIKSISNLKDLQTVLGHRTGNYDRIKLVIEELTGTNYKLATKLTKFDPLWLKQAMERAVKAYIAMILAAYGKDPKKAIEAAGDPEIRLRYKGGKLVIDFIADRRMLTFMTAKAFKKIAAKKGTKAGEDIVITDEELQAYLEALKEKGATDSMIKKALAKITSWRRRSNWLIPAMAGGEPGRPLLSLSSPVSLVILGVLYAYSPAGPISESVLADLVELLLPGYLSRRDHVYKYIERLRAKGLIEVQDGDVWLTELGELWVLANAHRVANAFQRYVKVSLIAKSTTSASSSPTLLSRVFSLIKRVQRLTQTARSTLRREKSGQREGSRAKRGGISEERMESLADTLLRFISEKVREQDEDVLVHGVLPLDLVVEATKFAFELDDVQKEMLRTALLMAHSHGVITFSIEQFSRTLKKVAGIELTPDDAKRLVDLNWKRILFFDRRKGTVGLWDVGKLLLALVRPSVETAAEQVLRLLVRAMNDEEYLRFLLQSRGVKPSCIRDVEEAVSLLRELERLREG